MKKVTRAVATAVLVSGLVLGPFVPNVAGRLAKHGFKGVHPRVLALQVKPLGWAGGGSST